MKEEINQLDSKEELLKQEQEKINDIQNNIKGNIENITKNKYLEILSKIRKKEISEILINQLMFLTQDIKNFNKIIEDNKIKELLITGDLKLLEKLFNLEGFNFKLFLRFCNKEKSFYDFIVNHYDTYYKIYLLNEIILIDIYNIFKKLNNTNEVYKKNFLKILDLKKITIKKLNKLLDSKFNSLLYKKTFSYFLKINNIKSISELNYLINSDKKFEHYLPALILDNKNEIDEIYKLTQNDNNTYNIKIGNTDQDIGACKMNEEYNYEILKNFKYNYVIIKIEGEIIGIIKKEGKRSFLSFKDVFDKNGKLIFVKGWVYNLYLDYKDFEKLFNNGIDCVDLKNKKGTKRKPIKKIKSYNNKKLYKNFDLIIKKFLKKRNKTFFQKYYKFKNYLKDYLLG